MKRISALAGLVLLAALRAHGQQAGAEQEIRRLDREWGEAVVRRDAAALGRLLADDYTLIEPSGQISDKAGELAGVKAPAFDFVMVSYRTEGVSVTFAGGRATVTGLAVFEAALEGRKITRAPSPKGGGGGGS